MITRGNPSAVLQSEKSGRIIGHGFYSPFNRKKFSTPKTVAQEISRIGRPTHPVEMSTSVGPAQQRVLVIPRVLTHLPARIIIIRRHGPEHGLEIVLKNNINERIEVFNAALRCNLLNESP
jgi:hypothetical protein